MPPSLQLSPESAPSIIGAIPARYDSERLPGKVLLPLAGRPMIEHVWRRAMQAEGLARIVVLTDDERVATVVERFGAEWEMTPRECVSGTDRIAFAARAWRADGVVNIQGDEPLVDPELVSQIAGHLAFRRADPVVTAAAPASTEELENPNVVKVVTDLEGYALYFSRSAIPFLRRTGTVEPRRHLGLYGYQRQTLLRLAELEPTPLESTESLEQLRALEHGIPIRVLEVPTAPMGVDTAEDLARVERLIQEAEKPAEGA